MERATELISFTKHLYYLTKMGASLTETFHQLRDSIKDSRFKTAIEDMEERMEGGESLPGAMAAHPKLFSAEYIRMIQAAEETETLPQVLSELASYLESVELTRRHIRGAALYPGIVINFAFLFVMAVHFFASNSLFVYYVKMAQEFPLRISGVTWFFIIAARFIFSPVFLVIMLIIVIFLDFMLFTRTAVGTTLLLKLPFVRDIFRKSYMVRVARALGFMLKQGETLDNALRLTAKTAESPILEKVLINAAEEVRRGVPLSKSFQGVELFDNTFLFMIKNGEEREDLPQALFEAADYFEEDLKGFYQNILRFMEPAFLITVGIIVGFMMVSIFLPFYSLTGEIN